MAHTSAGRKLGKKQGHRIQMLRSLTSDLIRYEQIKTTVPKAKECKRLADRIISAAKKNDLNAKKRVAKDIRDKDVFKKIFDVLVGRYAERTGGFTRLFRISRRQGDNAEIALIKLIA